MCKKWSWLYQWTNTVMCIQRIKATWCHKHYKKSFQPSIQHPQFLEFCISVNQKFSELVFSKFWRIRVPTRALFSRQISKLCDLSRVKAPFKTPNHVNKNHDSLPGSNLSDFLHLYTRLLIRIFARALWNWVNVKQEL